MCLNKSGGSDVLDGTAHLYTVSTSLMGCLSRAQVVMRDTQLVQKACRQGKMNAHRTVTVYPVNTDTVGLGLGLGRPDFSGEKGKRQVDLGYLFEVQILGVH